MTSNAQAVEIALFAVMILAIVFLVAMMIGYV